MRQPLAGRRRKVRLAPCNASNEQRVQDIVLAPGGRAANLLDELSRHLFELQADGRQMLRQCETVGARAFDADSCRANPERKSLDPGKAPAVVGGRDRVELSSQLIDRARRECALVGVDTDDAFHHPSLVPMQHDVDHRSDNNPLSSTRFYKPGPMGPEADGGRLRSKPAAPESCDIKSMSHPAGPGPPSHHETSSRPD